MKFLSIFAHNLYSTEYEAPDLKQLSMPQIECKYRGHELERLRNKWTDVEYLRNFYQENIKYFCENFWEGITKEEFVLGVSESIPHLLCEIRQMCLNNTIDEMFKPLDDRLYKTTNLRLLEVKSAHGRIKGRFALRIYAIRLDEASYLITGGAIKVSKQMEEHALTALEVQKMNYTKAHLVMNGVFDIESFEEYKNS